MERKKILGWNRRWMHIWTSTDKLMKDSSIARMPNKKLRGIPCSAMDIPQIYFRPGQNWNFIIMILHSHSKLWSSKFFFKFLFTLKCLTPSLSAIWMEDLPIPLQCELHTQIKRTLKRDEDRSSPFKRCLLLEIHKVGLTLRLLMAAFARSETYPQVNLGPYREVKKECKIPQILALCKCCVESKLQVNSHSVSFSFTCQNQLCLSCEPRADQRGAG